MVLHWPQITYLVLCLIGLCVTANEHGKSETVNFFTRVAGWFVSLFLLAAGGFFGGVSCQ